MIYLWLNHYGALISILQCLGLLHLAFSYVVIKVHIAYVLDDESCVEILLKPVLKMDKELLEKS